MHSIGELGTSVPAFLIKLWKIVEDPETNDLICWSPGGASFIIKNQTRFARELLPLYYKHNNMASFIRQLNMYGFHKIVSIENSGLKMDNGEMEFAHQCFLMGHPYLLEHIKRKVPTSKVEEACTAVKPELLNKVLSEVKGMRGRQDTLDTQLTAMKRENEVLWREVAILRQKHLKQQQIVNKLIQFLVTMVQSSRNGGIGIKRHYPLMLNDTSHRARKVSKLRTDLSDINSPSSNSSPTGPVIHELDAADFLEDCVTAPETTSTEEIYGPIDLCSATLTDNGFEETPASNSNEIVSETVDPNICNRGTEELISFEKIPNSSNVHLNPSSIEVISLPSIGSKQSKNKNKRITDYSKSKKKRAKKSIKSSKILLDSKLPLDSSSVIEESDPLDNGVELLDTVLPTLMGDKIEELLQINSNNDESETRIAENLETVSSENQEMVNILPTDSLIAATDAAVSAINNMAAERKNTAGTEKRVSNKISSNISKFQVNDSNRTDNLTEKCSTISNTSTDTDTNEIDPLLDREPSTSNNESNMALACTGSNADDFHRDNLDMYVDTMQTDLDGLRDLLKGEGYSLDANTLLGVCAAIPTFEQDFLKLFGDDSLLNLSTADFDNINEEKGKNNSSGTELATYSTNLLDMVDVFGGSDTGEWSPQPSPVSNNLMDISLNELNTPQIAEIDEKTLFKK